VLLLLLLQLLLQRFLIATGHQRTPKCKLSSSH
jgi:hypothetical protein